MELIRGEVRKGCIESLEQFKEFENNIDVILYFWEIFCNRKNTKEDIKELKDFQNWKMEQLDNFYFYRNKDTLSFSILYFLFSLFPAL